jgi:hypothetical protein
MSQRGSPPSSWKCPQCERTVPAREARCHCGVTRAEVAGRPREDADTVPLADGPRLVLLAVLLLAACGLVVFTAIRDQQDVREAAASTASGERPRPVPRAQAREGGRPPASLVLPSLPPNFVPISPREDPPPSPAMKKTGVRIAVDASPSPTGMEEAWARATELLEPDLQRIADETSALRDTYAPFADRCLARDADANWLVAMKTGTLVPAGIPFTDQGTTLDCPGHRRRLVARGDQVKSELDAAERTARTAGVLPGHWRKLLAAHQLDLWDRY